MRILQFSPQFPFPARDGGKIGIANITRQFALQGQSVHFFAVSSVPPSPQGRKEAEQYTNALTIVETDTRNSPVNILRSMFSLLPLFVWKFCSPALFKAVEQVCKQSSFDIIHADHSSMIPLALHAHSILKIPIGLRLHNIEWMIWQRYAERFPAWLPHHWYLKNQATKLRDFEARHYGKMDICCPITIPDRDRAMTMAPEGKYRVATAGVNLEEWPYTPFSDRKPHSAVLATTYTWIHNVEGAVWFLEEVLPLILRVLPDFHLTLIGTNPPDHLRRHAGTHVTITGFVESVQPWLAEAGVYIAPLFVGSGIRIKILEAMATGLAVVATTQAAEGIEAGRGEGLFRADSADEFAEAIIQLCSNSELNEQAGRDARLYIEHHHTWEHSVAGILEEYKLLTGKPA